MATATKPSAQGGTGAAAKPKSLKEMMGERTRVKFKFSDIISEVSQDGTANLLTFVLEETIAQVNGRTINDRSNRSLLLVANNVDRIRANPEAQEEIERLIAEGKSPFKWVEEGKSGEFDCTTLRFDVSRNLEAWIVKTSLAAAGRAASGGGRNTLDDIKKRIEEAKAKTALKNVKVEGEGEGEGEEPETIA